MSLLELSSSETNLAIVIPAFNEELSISDVVSQVLYYGIPIVVDDGSSDKTVLLARQAGALVLKHDINLGYDAALSSGLFWAITLGFKYAVTMDADGQHSPKFLTYFMKELNDGADLVIGIRDRHQRFAEIIFSKISKKLWGIVDPLCGMKAYRLKILSKVGYFDSYSSIGTELAIKCSTMGMNIKNVPISTKLRKNKSRFGEGLRPNIKILKSLYLSVLKYGF